MINLNEVTITVEEVRQFVENQEMCAPVGVCCSEGKCLVANALAAKYGVPILVDYAWDHLMLQHPGSRATLVHKRDEESKRVAKVAARFDGLTVEYGKDATILRETALALLVGMQA